MFELPLVPLVPFGLPPASLALTGLGMLCFVLYLAVSSLAVGGSAFLAWSSYGRRPIESVRRAVLLGLPIAIPSATVFALGPLVSTLLVDPEASATLRAAWLPNGPTWPRALIAWVALPVAMTALATAARRCSAGSIAERCLSTLLLAITATSAFGWAWLHIVGREDRHGQPGVAELDLHHWAEASGRAMIGFGLSLAGASLLLRQRLGRAPGRHAVRCLRTMGRVGAILALTGALTASVAMAGPVPRDRLGLLFSPAASAYPLALLAGSGALVATTSWRRARHLRLLPGIAWATAATGLAGIRETVRVQALEYSPAVERHHQLASRQAWAWALFAVALVVAGAALWRRWSRPAQPINSSS